MQTLTNNDPYEGMPSQDTEFKVVSGEREWGVIRCGGPCRDDYRRIDVHVQDAQHFLKLQRPAIDSIEAAEKALGFSVLCTGSWRSCETATLLYRRDPNRYAPPSKGAHMRGLAIDVNQNLSDVKLAKIDKALKNRGWHQARPDDEPWHYSFGLQV
jgi:hypothetical protein